MIISEKGLYKAMSDAAAHGGYRIRFNTDEDTLTVLTDEWCVNIDNNVIPRKVIGLIAEHFGNLPSFGSFSVKKLKEEYDVQTYLSETFSQDVLRYAYGEQAQAMNTGIHAWCRDLYISKAGELAGARPVNLGLLDKPMQPQMIDGQSLMFSDDDSAVFVAVCGNEGLNASGLTVWDALKGVDWWKNREDDSEAVPESEAEQMEIEPESDEPEGTENPDGAEDGGEENA